MTVIPISRGSRAAPRAVREQVTVYGSGNAWAKTAQRFSKMIDREARRFADKDPGLYADLVQTAHIAIWELDPSRYPPEEHGYFRKSVKNQIFAAMRQEANEALWGIVQPLPDEDACDEHESYD